MKKSIFLSAMILWVSAATADENVYQANPENYFVFVGEYVSVKEIEVACPSDAICMDVGYKATYKVLKPVYGNFSDEIIEFTAFDHYGRPNFADLKFVLLFLRLTKSGAFHEKYQYYDVFPTNDGVWVHCGDGYYPDTPEDIRLVKSTKLAADYVVDHVHNFNKDHVRQVYRPPTYELVGDSVLCRFGTDVNGLFQVKRETVLKDKSVIFSEFND